MHISHRSDDQLQKSLKALLGIIPTYQHHYFYNGALVNPYLFASHGLAITRKRQMPIEGQKVCLSAVCTDQHCNLSIALDGHDEIEAKEELQSVIRDHDSECSYYKVKDNLICFKLFVRLGKWIFQEGLAALKAKNVWIQLNPAQISNLCSKQEDSYGSIWSQIKQLDSSISQQSFTKVNSNIILAIFGWKWTSKTLLTCRFCGSTRDVSQFISPLEFSLLKMSEGFSFIEEHHSWCCLVAPAECYWQEILRQAVVGRLKGIEGRSSKNLLELQCKNIQRNLLQILSEQLPRMNSLRRQIEHKKSSLQSRLVESQEKQVQREEGQLQQKQQAQRCLLMHYSRLWQILQEQRKSEQDLILKIQAS